MLQQNAAIARRVFDEIIVGGNLDLIGQVFSADYQDHDPANEEDTRGHEGVKGEIGMYRNAFPDLGFTLEAQIAEGDLVTTRWTFQGTHRGELMGTAPTGKQVTITGITIHRIADGKIAEGWWNWDTLGMMQQIGAIPAGQAVG